MTFKIGNGNPGKNNLVSVIIVTYNHKHFLHETIESVICQDYEPIEIIITDDGSTDGSVEIIKEYEKKYPQKIKAIFSKINTGIPGNVNRGLEQATGEFIAWLGGDDIMLPSKLKKQVKILHSNPKAIGCCHDAEIFNSIDGKIYGLFSELMNGQKGIRNGGVELWFDSKYYMLPSTVMFRSIATPLHGFDLRLKFLNDWLFDVEVFQKGQCIALQDNLVRYRRHQNNATGSDLAKSINLEENLIALSIVESRYPQLYSLVRKRRINCLLSAAVFARNSRDLFKFRKYLYMAFQEGAIFRVPLLWFALLIAGQFVEHQLKGMPHNRSKLFTKLSNLIK